MVHGPAAGLALLEALDADPRLASHHRLAGVRAHLLEKAGDSGAARAHYLAAASRTSSIPERDYLMMKAARLREAESVLGPELLFSCALVEIGCQ
jgi:predicted RNA polymerase sigma factor